MRRRAPGRAAGPASAPRRRRRGPAPCAMRIVVVLPAPLAPKKPNIDPGATAKPTRRARGCRRSSCGARRTRAPCSPVVVVAARAPYRPLASRRRRRVRCHRRHEPRNCPRNRPRASGLAGLRDGRRRVPGVRAVGAGDPDRVRRGSGDGADRLRRRAARRPGGPDGRAVRRPRRASCSTGHWPTPGSTAGTPTSPTR